MPADPRKLILYKDPQHQMGGLSYLERRVVNSNALIGHYLRYSKAGFADFFRNLWWACYQAWYSLKLRTKLALGRGLDDIAIQELRLCWVRHYGRDAVYARSHQGKLTEYGRLAIIELPDLLDRILAATRKHP